MTKRESMSAGVLKCFFCLYVFWIIITTNTADVSSTIVSLLSQSEYSSSQCFLTRLLPTMERQTGDCSALLPTVWLCHWSTHSRVYS